MDAQDEDTYMLLVAFTVEFAVLAERGEVSGNVFRDCIPVRTLDDDMLCNPEMLCDFVRNNFGLQQYDVSLVRFDCECMSRYVFKGHSLVNWIQRAVVFEVHNPKSSHAFGNLTNFCLVPWSRISQLHVPLFNDKEVSEFLRYFELKGQSASAGRLSPFQEFGWLRKTCAWVESELRKLFGTDHEFCFKYVQMSSRSCVLEIIVKQPGKEFKVFLKSQPLLNKTLQFGHEATILSALGAHFNDCFREPLAYNALTNSFIIEQIGSALPTELRNNSDQFQLALNSWANVQLESVAVIESLVKSGVPLHYGDSLRRALQEMAGNGDWWISQREFARSSHWIEVREKRGLSKEFNFTAASYAELLLSVFDECVEAWNSSGMPLSLVHGDLHWDNVLINKISGSQGSFRFIDFQRTVVSVPFEDAIRLARYSDATWDDLDEYLLGWTRFLSGSNQDEKLQHLRWLLPVAEFFSQMRSALYDYYYFCIDGGQQMYARGDMSMLLLPLIENVSHHLNMENKQEGH